MKGIVMTDHADEQDAPVATQSLAPRYLNTEWGLKRLDEIPLEKRGVDPENIMMRLWEEENVPNAGVDYGLVPLRIVTHRCDERCKDPKYFGHTFAPVNEEHARIAARVVQWLASNVGRAYYAEFERRVREAQKPKG